ncbi:hypothetical protein AJ78_06318 [Emergomyces pasteurianus Ep9510]|uniref:Uncharacterized protein n=1 Tax=Emergomyces pasteurianus Ep9510 TaxID=1447872 RepID=A0A1J9P9N4_9EURO|nr:hypothetical protein AJ78_06318 [Emergomyces pasteurianus Ep9510]
MNPENWTEEHRLRLKAVVDQRGLNILSTSYTRRSQSCSPSRTSTLDGGTSSLDSEWEAIERELLQKNENYYRNLIERDGRPASSLKVLYAPGDCGEYEDILNYWGSRGGLLGQLWAWIDFRRF